MDAREPDFCLASTEFQFIAEPRRAYRLRRVRFEGRDDLLLIRVEPPLITDAGYGLRAGEWHLLAIATRHVGVSLFPVSEWPVHVHVAVPTVEDADTRESFQKDELVHYAWGELYRTESVATEEMRRFWAPPDREMFAGPQQRAGGLSGVTCGPGAVAVSALIAMVWIAIFTLATAYSFSKLGVVVRPASWAAAVVNGIWGYCLYREAKSRILRLDRLPFSRRVAVYLTLLALMSVSAMVFSYFVGLLSAEL